jgi:glutathione S-transferase
MQLQQSSHAEMMSVLNVLDKNLEPRTFLVGNSLTLADIAVATAALLPFKYVSQVFVNIYLVCISSSSFFKVRKK